MNPKLASCLLLGALFAGCAPALAQVDPPPSSSREQGFVEVTGTAQRDVPVDRATLVFAVETEATGAGAAVEENAARMDAVVGALRQAGAPGLTLETSGFDLQPRYGRADPQSPSDRRIVGYRATNNLTVTVDDVDAVGSLIDVAVSAGANRVAGLTFEARDTEAVRLEVLGEAVENARRQAQAMADALGVPLGVALEVRGGAQRPSPRPLQFALRAEMSMAAPATPVEAGDQTVTASATIRYRLGSGRRP